MEKSLINLQVALRFAPQGIVSNVFGAGKMIQPGTEGLAKAWKTLEIEKENRMLKG